jgi:hypothetical protein
VEVEMAERRCANCPPEPAKILPPVSGLALEDGKRLWHPALVTCNTVIEMMRVYTHLGVLGGTAAPLRQMASNLLEIAQTVEEYDASNSSQK